MSQRTVYRDIESLRRQGAKIIGEVGIGYVLKEGLLLPPLMFSVEEIEAIVLGSKWVENHGDKKLSEAASQSIAKIKSVIPKSYRQQVEDNTLFTPLMSESIDGTQLELSASKVRQAIREEKPLDIVYKDGDSNNSHRKIHPFSLAFFDSIQVIGAWCLLRNDFRHFRVDRIVKIKLLNQKYSPNRKYLFNQWRKKYINNSDCQ